MFYVLQLLTYFLDQNTLILTQTTAPIENAKITEKNKEIKLLKSQLNSLEEQIGELQDRENALKRSLDVKTVECKREKEINTLLMQKQSNSEKRENISAGDRPQQEARKKVRGLCCHEMLKPKSCPFPNCMFSHQISDEDRSNQAFVTAAQQKKLSIQSKRQSENLSNPICEVVFKNGPGSCNPECNDFHALDFDRIKRGICYLHITGTCQRGNRCWFTHQVPLSVRNDPRTIKAADDFTKAWKLKSESRNNGLVDNIEESLASGNTNTGTEENNYIEEIPDNTQNVHHPNSHGVYQNPNDLTENRNVLPPVYNDVQNQPQRQPSFDDSFLLLVKTMIQDQIRQCISQPTQQYMPYPPWATFQPPVNPTM